MKNHAIGICKLTGKSGKFVNAHIIPEALSKRELPDVPMKQSGYGTRPKRRWTSWYDPQLVTDAGEKILSAYDDCAVKELRARQRISARFGDGAGEIV